MENKLTEKEIEDAATAVFPKYKHSCFKIRKIEYGYRIEITVNNGQSSACIEYNSLINQIGLYKLYTKIPYRGLGMGTAILKMTEELVKELNISQLFVWPAEGSFQHKWYTERGYIETGGKFCWYIKMFKQFK